MNAKSFKRSLTLSFILTAVCAAASVLFAAESYAPIYLRALILISAFLLMVLFNVRHIKRLQAVIKMHEEKLENSERRYRIFDEFSDNVHFDADIAEDKISFNSNFECLFGQKPGITKLSEWRSLMSFIVLEDLQEVIKTWEGAMEGFMGSSSDIRIIDADGQLLWFRLSMVAQFDKNSEAVRILGRLTNIDAEVRRVKRQRIKAMQDPVTHLYHRIAAHDLVDEFLKSEGKRGKHAMLIIKIDNPSELTAALLVGFSKLLKQVFRSTDILARTGTCEFMVFLRDIPGDYIVEYKITNLLKALNSLNKERQREPISCLIGSAFYGKGALSFSELFERAEKSIYDIKNIETNDLSFFSVQDEKKTSGF